MNDGNTEEIAADALWWIGWKPHVVCGVGAAAGVLAGYFRGGMGPMAVAASVLFIALGLVKPSLLKTGFVASLAAAVSFFVVGTERVTNALETVGLESLAETVSVFLVEIATSADAEFEPTSQPTEVVGSAVAGVAFWSLVGAAAGVVFWLLGVYTVNRRHDSVRETLVENAREAGATLLGDDGSLRTLTHGEGSVFLVTPAERYSVTNVLVGESSVSLHYGSVVDMAAQEVEMSDSMKELYYDQISSVDYGGDRLRIRSADGGTVRVITSEKPVELLEEIESRLQKYKKKKKREQNSSESRGTEEAEQLPTGDEVLSETESEETEKHEREAGHNKEKDSDVNRSETQDETEPSDTEIEEILDDLDGVEEMLSDADADDDTENTDYGDEGKR